MKISNKKLILKSVVFFMLFMLVLVSVGNSNAEDIKNEKIAYITFDDGPSKYTKEIVDILDENNVKGTFFMLNDNMIVFKNVVSHELSKLYATDDSAIEEFKTCNKTFYNITGETSRLVRIPFGSKPNMLENIYNKFVEEGFLVWDWNIDTEDWKSSPDQILSNILYYARGKKEVVILLHENPRTVSCLNDIIAILKERGYDIRPITQDVKPKNFW